MPSPQVTVSDNGGAPVDPVASGIGVNVTAGHTIVVQLQNVAADDWSCNLIGQDDQVATPVFTLDPVGKNVTFVAPAAPFALVFESVVNKGVDLNTNAVATYRQRFAIYATATGGFRVLASNERNEGSALFGWIVAFNAFVRLLAGGATGDAVIQPLASNGDANQTLAGTVGNNVYPITALTASRTYLMPPAPTLGMICSIPDARKLYTGVNKITLGTVGGVDHFWVGGVDKGTSYVIDPALFTGGTLSLVRLTASTWEAVL